MTVYIPSNLDFEKLLQRYPINLVTDKKGPKKDYLAYVVGIISKGIYLQGQEFNASEFSAPIWSELLKELIGEKYKKYIAYLREANVITTNRQFLIGKSRRYSFTEKYQSSFKPYRISDGKLIRKIELRQEREREYARRKLPHLYKWVLSRKLSIDEIDAKAILPRKFETKLAENKNRSGGIAFANIALRTWERNIENIQSKKYVSSFVLGRRGGGRLYTTLTNTSRDFRPFIKYDGKTLCHVDISNSQPYFAALLLNPNFWLQSMLNANQRKKIIGQFHNQSKNVEWQSSHRPSANKFKISPNIKSSISYQDYMAIVTLLESPESAVNQEFDKYKKYVSSGNFYQLVADEYNESLNPRKRANREDVKKWMFGVFFSENPPFAVDSLLAPQTRIFRKLFPTISKIFTIIKKEKHNTLALLLQNLESQCLLYHICGLIAQKHPEIPLFTIHDSIVTTSGNEDNIKQIMSKELEKLTCLPPTLKAETWDEKYHA